MSAQQSLLALLADGELHSGSELAAQLGVTRSAVWKHIGQLEKLGLEVEAQAGQGYRLTQPIELLDADAIAASLQPRTRAIAGKPELVWSSPSTNSALLAAVAPEPGKAHVLLAEHQSAGRGRRGRRWLAPAGHGICLSVAWKFARSPDNLACVGLAIGVGVLRALQRAGLSAARLKWPNDIVVEGRKLAGILVDVQGEAGGPLHVIVGVGVNMQLSPAMRKAVVAVGGIEPAAMLDAAGVMGRNKAAACLIDELCNALEQFGASGFAAFADAWEAADYLLGRAVKVQTDTAEMFGTAMGITPAGHLRVLVDGQEQEFVTGDVSVRPN